MKCPFKKITETSYQNRDGNELKIAKTTFGECDKEKCFYYKEKECLKVEMQISKTIYGEN